MVPSQALARVFSVLLHRTQHQLELARHLHLLQDYSETLEELQRARLDYLARIISQEELACLVPVVPQARVQTLDYSVVAKQHLTLAKQSLQQRQVVVCSRQRQQHSQGTFSKLQQLQVAAFSLPTQPNNNKHSNPISRLKSFEIGATSKV